MAAVEEAVAVQDCGSRGSGRVRWSERLGRTESKVSWAATLSASLAAPVDARGSRAAQATITGPTGRMT